jgi:small-conductance mechanosensitive channel
MTQTQLIFTIVALLTALIINLIFSRSISKLSKKSKISLARGKGIKKILRLFLFILTTSSIIIIWGIQFQNIWVALTSVLALIAVGFFAVWSMLSNILASLIIFFSKPFKIGDEIKIIPEEIKGKVVSVGSIFTTLKTEKEIINIPNNLIMQRVIIKTLTPNN